MFLFSLHIITLVLTTYTYIYVHFIKDITYYCLNNNILPFIFSVLLPFVPHAIAAVASAGGYYFWVCKYILMT